MLVRSISVAAALLLSLTAGALARTMPPAMSAPVSANAVGRWVYDLQDKRIGSVRAVDGRAHTTTIMVGSYFQPGSHPIRLPSDTMSIVAGRVTLDAATASTIRLSFQG